MGGIAPTLGMAIGLPKELDEEIKELAGSIDMEPKQVIAAAIALKVKEWLEAEDVEKAIKQDLMLEKLYRR